MLLFAFLLILAHANGWVIPSWGWVVFGLQIFFEMLGLICKYIAKQYGD